MKVIIPIHDFYQSYLIMLLLLLGLGLRSWIRVGLGSVVRAGFRVRMRVRVRVGFRVGLGLDLVDVV